jgi:hypothetical protein
MLRMTPRLFVILRCRSESHALGTEIIPSAQDNALGIPEHICWRPKSLDKHPLFVLS